jgi:hypothetical protein
MSGNPNHWRITLVLVIVAMVTAQSLIATVMSALPWLIAGLGILLCIVVLVGLYIRRTRGW